GVLCAVPPLCQGQPPREPGQPASAGSGGAVMSDFSFDSAAMTIPTMSATSMQTTVSATTRFARSLLASAILLATGCAVWPDYESVLDDAPAQQAFVTTDATALDTATVADDWWQLYNDTTLNALVEEALAANTDLRVAEANLRRVDALWR